MVNFNSVFEGENKIQNLIKNDNNCSAHFEYTIVVRAHKAEVLTSFKEIENILN